MSCVLRDLGSEVRRQRSEGSLRPVGASAPEGGRAHRRGASVKHPKRGPGLTGQAEGTEDSVQSSEVRRRERTTEAQRARRDGERLRGYVRYGPGSSYLLQDFWALIPADNVDFMTLDGLRSAVDKGGRKGRITGQTQPVFQTFEKVAVKGLT